MKTDFDVIIIGSGPAGVSTAFPLVKSGLSVLMVDGGKKPSVMAPETDFLSARASDKNQWKWMVGKGFHALKMHDAVSPKLRVPPLAYVFDQFEHENQIVNDKFITIGSLATGGLSNAWGGGVACFSSDELKAFPFSASELEISYKNVAERIGISGCDSDDLSDFFGLGQWMQSPIEMDKMHGYLLKHYNNSKHKFEDLGFKMGRAPVAVLSKNKGQRLACDQLGNCLWGCSRGALYSSADELTTLCMYDNFTFQPGFVVKGISQDKGISFIEGRAMDDSKSFNIRAKKICLAAGTLASTRLVLKALQYKREVPLLSCPTAAFMLWVPQFLGEQRRSSANVGQLAFKVSLDKGVTGFGATFATTGIGMSEFLRRAPLKRPVGIDVFRNLLSSCVVGNMFLPGNLTQASVRLREHGDLVVVGKHADKVKPLMNEAETKLRQSYLKIGAILLPKSFTIGSVGGDIHYAGTLPMKDVPLAGETSRMGEVMSLSGIHVVDGASLPTLPAKSHTFMIMANADRIGREIASSFGIS